MHEKQLYRESSFLTLTYNEKCLGNTLVKRDLQLVRQSSGTGQTETNRHVHVTSGFTPITDINLARCKGEPFHPAQRRDNVRARPLGNGTVQQVGSRSSPRGRLEQPTLFHHEHDR